MAEAIASAAREAGAEIRTEAPVARVLVRNGRVTGVALANGDEVHGKVVSSSLDPPAPSSTWSKRMNCPGSWSERCARFASADLRQGQPGARRGPRLHLHARLRPPSARRGLHQPLPRLPRARLRRRQVRGVLEGALHRHRHPFGDRSRDGPPGKHVMSCFVQYAPYELREGNWDDRREAFGDAVVDTLARYAPNLKDIILHRQVLTPLDIERTTGLSQGNIFRGELSPSQLFFLRPAAGTRSTARRCAATTSAAPGPTRAAASWGPRGSLRPAPCSLTWGGDAGGGDGDGSRTPRCQPVECRNRPTRRHASPRRLRRGRGGRGAQRPGHRGAARARGMEGAGARTPQGRRGRRGDRRAIPRMPGQPGRPGRGPLPARDRLRPRPRRPRARVGAPARAGHLAHRRRRGADALARPPAGPATRSRATARGTRSAFPTGPTTCVRWRACFGSRWSTLRPSSTMLPQGNGCASCVPCFGRAGSGNETS